MKNTDIPAGSRITGASLAAAILGTLLMAPAIADGDRGEPRVPLLPAYHQECASCHTAFPPGLLPAASWQRLMGNLPKHFGTDASLDATVNRQLTAWLIANAGTRRQFSSPPADDRITRADWFVRKHREVPAATWKLPAVKSAANCAACHTKSNQGQFNEHDIRLPR